MIQKQPAAAAAAGRLVEWYRKNQRKLPWRETSDPFKVWVSETMLQQTRVETVIPYYYAFLDRFPTVLDLAAADESEVVKMWQGLGYYSRARNLHKAAKQVAGEYGGRIPDQAEAFQSLAGVGPYTAGAVQSIAFNQPVAAVDGNVLRVMARFLAVREEVRSRPAVAAITETVETWLKEQSPRLLTQALMELGALICTPRNPQCLDCPIQSQCAAWQQGLTQELPVRKKQGPRQMVQVVALWCQQNTKVLLQQRPDAGLLAGMWQLPASELSTSDPLDSETTHAEAEKLLRQLLGDTLYKVTESQAPSSGLQGLSDKIAERAVRNFHELAQVKHIFTHVEWHVQVLQPVGWPLEKIPERHGLVFADAEKLSELAVPRVYDKLLSSFLG